MPPNTRGEWPVSCEAGRSNSGLRSLEIVRYFRAFRMTIREAWGRRPAERGLDTGPARPERALIPDFPPRSPAVAGLDRSTPILPEPAGVGVPPPIVGSEKVRYGGGRSSSTRTTAAPVCVFINLRKGRAANESARSSSSDWQNEANFLNDARGHRAGGRRVHRRKRR